MTLVSAILLSAFRESNLVAGSASLNSTQETEALNRFNPLVTSVIGWEAGENLKQWSIGTTGYANPPASLRQENWKYPPINSMLVLNHSQAETVYLPECPSDGARIAVQDIRSQLATYNVTLNGNGRMIEAAATLTLSTDDLNRTWFYRADLGDWRRVSTLATGDEMPFPVEFDDMFIIMLAARLNPRYGRKMDPLTVSFLDRSRKMFEARYRQSEDIKFAPDFARNPEQSYDGLYDGGEAVLYRSS
jgi:hypothetical protein